MLRYRTYYMRIAVEGWLYHWGCGMRKMCDRPVTFLVWNICGEVTARQLGKGRWMIIAVNFRRLFSWKNGRLTRPLFQQTRVEIRKIEIFWSLHVLLLKIELGGVWRLGTTCSIVEAVPACSRSTVAAGLILATLAFLSRNGQDGSGPQENLTVSGQKKWLAKIEAAATGKREEVLEQSQRLERDISKAPNSA